MSMSTYQCTRFAAWADFGSLTNYLHKYFATTIF